MIQPTKVEIAMSMLEREAVNILGRFGLANHPLVSIGLEAGKKLYGDKIRNILSSVIENDTTIDVGADIAKDGLSSCIDNFSARLKERLNENKEA